MPSTRERYDRDVREFGGGAGGGMRHRNFGYAAGTGGGAPHMSPQQAPMGPMAGAANPYMNSAMPQGAPAAQAAATQHQGADWTFHVLRMRGLPFSANEQHIMQFFHGYHMAAVLPSTVPVDGRPSGEAYVQFTDANEAWRAYQHKQGAMMERRWIELFPTSKAEMDFAAAGGDPKAFRDGRAQPGGAMGGGGMPPY
eukprot:GHVT01095521.1.p1 GENE.GHVT01095521.1~~GHVT01095521.1.p1  ORF type:complete len:197 (-),score=48.63 GHVT01095521.1:931-1521(-)